MPISNYRLIGIVGRKGSGKDTIGSVLESIEGEKWERIAFADSLKEVTMELFDLTSEEVNDPKLKETELLRWPCKTPRFYLQRVGQAINEICPCYWVRKWYQRINLGAEPKRIYVPDVRFPFEAAAIKRLGGLLIRINRPSVRPPWWKRLWEHSSERFIDNLPVDYEIENIEGSPQTAKDLLLQLTTDYRSGKVH